jgi:hypothetical protein
MGAAVAAKGQRSVERAFFEADDVAERAAVFAEIDSHTEEARRERRRIAGAMAVAATMMLGFGVAVGTFGALEAADAAAPTERAAARAPAAKPTKRVPEPAGGVTAVESPGQRVAQPALLPNMPTIVATPAAAVAPEPPATGRAAYRRLRRGAPEAPAATAPAAAPAPAVGAAAGGPTHTPGAAARPAARAPTVADRSPLAPTAEGGARGLPEQVVAAEQPTVEPVADLEVPAEAPAVPVAPALDAADGVDVPDSPWLARRLGAAPAETDLTEPGPDRTEPERPESPAARSGEIASAEHDARQSPALVEARTLLDAQRFEDALAFLADVDEPAAHALRARAHYELGNDGDAMRSLFKSDQVDPGNGEALIIRGLILQHRGWKRDARRVFETYLESHPGGSHAEEIRAVLDQL